MRLRPSFVVCLLALCSLALTGCSADANAKPPALPPAMVLVSTVVEEPVVDYYDFTGRTDAPETVEIRAQVTGFLNKVMFEAGEDGKGSKEGREVAKGTLLYEIDDREYRADFASATAEKASALAQQEKTAADLKRTENLLKKGAATQEDLDQASAAKKQADAAVDSAVAKIERAQLNLDFTKIEAPIDGKLSRTMVTKGNLVTADTTLLTTLVSVDPIYVYFDVDERVILTLRDRVRSGQLEKPDFPPIMMGLTNEKGFPHNGEIDFSDNRADPQTGTIRIRGRFKNPPPEAGKPGDRVLAPGLFARIRLPIGKPKNALLVTDRAIGTDQGQKFVYVVNDKNEVVFRGVKLGSTHDGLRVISEGLAADEQVIVDGLQRVRPGVVVNPKAVGMRDRPGEAIDKIAAEGKSNAKADEHKPVEATEKAH